jgi:hypothetical protein
MRSRPHRDRNSESRLMFRTSPSLSRTRPIPFGVTGARAQSSGCKWARLHEILDK